MNRLKHRAPIPNVGRTCQTNRPRNLRRHIRKNIPVQVRHDDDIERFRSVRQLRRPDIHNPVLLLNLPILRPNLIKHLMKKTISHLHDVVLNKAGDFFAPISPRVLKGITHNLLAAWTTNQFQTLHHIMSLPVLDARVGVLLILPNNHYVHSRVLRPNVRRVSNTGTNIGIKPECLARCHVQAFITATLRGRNRCL